MDPSQFLFDPIDPEKSSMERVYLKAADGARGELLGAVSETASSGWIADHNPGGGHRASAHGFQTKELAADFLYRFEPPVQSRRSRPFGQANPFAVAPGADTSLCGCCVDASCACEGTRRVNGRPFDQVIMSVIPSLIPAPGVLFSLVARKDGFIVDMNTQGAGVGIGFLKRRADDRYELSIGPKKLGTCQRPETGMWACLKAHTVTRSYARYIGGFNCYGNGPDDA